MEYLSEPLLPNVLPETLPGHGPANSASTPSGMGRIGGFGRQRPGGAARVNGRRQPSRSHSRSDPEVVPWTSSLVSARGSELGEANFLVE